MVQWGSTRRWVGFLDEGSKSLRVTSGGMETGAAPIRDSHLDELENARTADTLANAGRRKSGAIELLAVAVRARSTVVRAGHNMVMEMFGQGVSNSPREA